MMTFGSPLLVGREVATSADRERYTASQVFLLLAAIFAVLFSTAVALLIVDQHRVLVASERLQQQTVPAIIRFQRLARNLEKLRLEGDRMFTSETSEERRQSLFIVMLVANHPSILEHPESAEVARDTETFLVETGRLAAQDPASLRLRLAEWLLLVRRLSLLVDDISVQGANLATTDFGDMATAIRFTSYKMIATMSLIGGFLVLLMVLLRQQLLRPLQRIDRALSSLSVDQPAPEFPELHLAELHAVGEATRRLHSAMFSNETARRQLELLANRDDLTGLINRRHFMAAAQAELRRAQRYGRPIVVAIGDLDYFKSLNDTYGHGAGDAALCSFAGLLSEGLRQSDLVCRYGGEEFAFLFPESSVEQARILVERFRERVAAHDIALPDGLQVRITMSIGLADASHCPLELALQRADLALYEAKRLGRNRVTIAVEAG